jgi:hypothetical protein
MRSADWLPVLPAVSCANWRRGCKVGRVSDANFFRFPSSVRGDLPGTPWSRAVEQQYGSTVPAFEQGTFNVAEFVV